MKLFIISLLIASSLAACAPFVGSVVTGTSATATDTAAIRSVVTFKQVSSGNSTWILGQYYLMTLTANSVAGNVIQNSSTKANSVSVIGAATPAFKGEVSIDLSAGDIALTLKCHGTPELKYGGSSFIAGAVF